MSDSSPEGLELTPDLIEYAKGLAAVMVTHQWDSRVATEDVVGQIMLHLIRALPDYDPSRGLAPKSWVHMVVAKAVPKYAGREWKKVKRLRPLPGSKDAPAEPTTDQATALGRWHGRWPADYEAAAARVEEALDLIDNEESKRMCRLLIEHNGNRSAVAREMKIDEGTVRYRIEKILQPKMLSIGFDLFSERDTS